MKLLERQANERIETAWLGEWMARHRRLPSLLSVLNRSSRQLTDDERAFAQRIRDDEGHRPIPDHVRFGSSPVREGAGQ